MNYIRTTSDALNTTASDIREIIGFAETVSKFKSDIEELLKNSSTKEVNDDVRSLLNDLDGVNKEIISGLNDCLKNLSLRISMLAEYSDCRYDR